MARACALRVIACCVAGLALVTAIPTTLPGAPAKCNMKPGTYPPDPSTALPWYDINLDLPPQDRWTEVVTPLGPQIIAMVDQVVDLLPDWLSKTALALLDGKEDEILNGFPKPYGDEIRGIIKATGIDPAKAILYNVAYELEGACTSIVAQDSEGHLHHARNLDFGLFFGWDKANRTWALTEKLRPLLFNARMIKNNQTFFNATYFAGYVGLLTGMKTGGFSITVDTRFDNNYDKGLIQWLRGNHTGNFVAFTTRSAMEDNATYSEALATLTSADMVGPSYIILGGAKPREGAIITREEAQSLNLWTLENDVQKKGFYVLETNYDHWKDPPFFDDRRNPAEACLENIGEANVGSETLFDLLSAQPNLNLLTTYTTLMNVNSGRFEAYRQRCEPPCTPW